MALMPICRFYVCVVLGLTMPLAAGPVGEDPCRGVAVDDARGEPREAAITGELVLVTGGSGFIGSHLVAKLLKLGYRVRVLDSLETGNILYLDLAHPRLEFHYGNILHMESVERAMEGVVGVFHLGAASKVLPSLKDPAMATFNYERNAVGTSRVLEAANKTLLVKKVVYAGSSTYYGNQPVPFQEDARFMPTSPYAASKYMGELEMVTADVVYGIPTVSLRYFMVYGPRNPEDGAYAIVTGKFAKRKLAGKPLIIEGTGQQFRDFVHVDDVARANILAYQSSERGTVINIGSGTAHSVKEVADIISPKQEYTAARNNDLNGTLADTCRAKRLLNFRTRYDFTTTMKEMMNQKTSIVPDSWASPAAMHVLERLPRWATSNTAERGILIREELEKDAGFLQKLAKELRVHAGNGQEL